jgi:hypothetical protein
VSITSFFFLFLMFAGPFWQEKMPADWTDVELSQFFVDSPWAQMVSVPSRSAPAPAIQVYLATAPLMAEAEKERDKRVKARRKAGQEEKEDPLAEEYQAWLEDNRATQIVIAIRMASNPKLSDEAEVKHMEEDSFLQVGRKKIKMTGHFPPTSRDPYLRLAFPRQPLGEEKTLTFALYIPGLPLPFREVQFRVKDLLVNGKLEL